MKTRGGDMESSGVLIITVVAIVIAIIGAVVIYTKTESNDYGTIKDSIKEFQLTMNKQTTQIQELKKANEDTSDRVTKLQTETLVNFRSECGEVINNVMKQNGHMATDVKDLKTNVGILQTHQHHLEKKLIAKERVVNLKLSDPIQVDLVPAPKPLPGSKRGKDSLLKRSGISPSTGR